MTGGGFDAMARALMGVELRSAGCGAASMASSFSAVAAAASARRGRPAGDASQALLSAAAQAGPATVRELADLAGVPYAAARYTSSRLVSRGELVPRPCDAPGRRPMVLAVRSFWETAAPHGAGRDDDDVDAEGCMPMVT